MECEPVKTIWQREHNPATLIVTSNTGFWEILESNHKVKGVVIPDTIVYKEGQLWRWYFAVNGVNNKPIIMRKNNDALNVDKIVKHFAGRLKHLTGYFKDKPRRINEFLPFLPVCFSHNNVEKFNTFWNFKETESMLTSLLRTIVYLQDHVPCVPHFDLFSSARFYCTFSEENGLGGLDRFKCYKEILEYADASMNPDSQLYRENAIDIAQIITNDDEAFAVKQRLWRELAEVKERRPHSDSNSQARKPGAKITRTYLVCEEYLSSNMIKVVLGESRSRGLLWNTSTSPSGSRSSAC